MPKFVLLKFCNCHWQWPVTTSDSGVYIAQVKQGGASLCIFICAISSEVWLGLLVSALKWQKLSNFLREELKPLEIESFILDQNISIMASLKTFSLRVICEFLYFLSILKKLRGKGKEMTYNTAKILVKMHDRIIFFIILILGWVAVCIIYLQT